MPRGALVAVLACVATQPCLVHAGTSVPVTAIAARTRDVPIIREGLGTVQALNAATIRVQVSGMLERVAVTEGQFLAKGQLIAQIDPRPFQAQLDQAEATLSRDKAVLANAKRDLNRTQPLVNRGYATNQRLATQSSSVDQAESTLRIDEAQIAAAKVQVDFTTIAAPFDGVTGIRLVDVGNVVHPTDASGLVMLTQVQPISVLFSLPAVDIPAVQASLGRGTVVAVAYGPDDATELDTGTLRLINQADPNSGTVQLKAQFPNADKRLWPGTFVNVHVAVDVDKGGVVVPLPAIQQGPDGLFVHVVGADDVARLRSVTVRQSRDNEALVASGLRDGERVVTDGQYGLSNGAKVAVVSGDAARRVQSSTAASDGLLP